METLTSKTRQVTPHQGQYAMKRFQSDLLVSLQFNELFLIIAQQPLLVFRCFTLSAANTTKISKLISNNENEIKASCCLQYYFILKVELGLL